MRTREDALVSELAALVRRAAEGWEPAVERAVFGTVDPDQIASAIIGFVGGRLGPVAEAVFYRPGVGVVTGLRLVDGSQVVVKVHRWNVTAARLAGVQTVQAHVAMRGLPAPRPLVAPESLGEGIATVEELLAGHPVDGHDRSVRRAVAVGLHAFITAAAELGATVDVGTTVMLRPPGGPLWFEPHDVRFDFDATAAGAEWIDELATLGRRRLDDAAAVPPVVGHFDWRVENLGFDRARIVGIYDWDSVAVAPEAVVVGNTAAQFTVDWTHGEVDPLPSVDEMRTFVDDYEQARGGPFTTYERELLDAANLFLCAYGARCQHSDMSLHPEIGGTTRSHWLQLLRDRGEHALLP